MASVVFLRGVNIGGRKVFRPSAFARQLKPFEVVSIGAAGTFIARKAVRQSTLRSELLKQLPFAADVMICPADDVMELIKTPSLRRNMDGRCFVSVLATTPKAMPKLPILHPVGSAWQVKVFARLNRFVVSLRSQGIPRAAYPNEIVEKHFGVPAATRSWNTMTAIAQMLE